ncbi:conserved exported hypothetical protein [Candidatus Accumulibacter aalborgensis]|uniref:Uncharacterized protein n=1 Tax=Candidatus Accumulibacter aalborgensis TaxID=1860102 RepID=A0A1A8XGD2_9PROT|nr:hypothetical protein [Candidatus Accumulibacter aalborgensis]SBT03771.1 conserved exported hypothetical protein [Candidatus Accumulibacter aalborgensis]
MTTKALSLLALVPVAILSGCAGNPMRSYDSELKATVTLVKTGQLQQALDGIEKNNTSMFASKKDEKTAAGGKHANGTLDNKDILYFLEKGEILNLQNNYVEGRDTWLQADEYVRTWEDEYKTNPSKLLGDVGSYLVSDRVRRYDGQDYEKVSLSTELTLNHIMLGDFDSARIEMKKTFEREKLIESFREKEYDKLKEEGEKQHISADTKQLSEKGYPMADLDTPDVRNLKNGFQNAFAHYLAGYFFEVTGEYSLAEPGYRNALALQPNSKLINDGLKRVGKRKPGVNESDVLFVIESGFAPAWKSVTIPIPIPTGKSMVVTPLSFPVIKAEDKGFVPPSVNAGGKELPVETLVNIDAMARRLLKDQLPGIMLRTVVRAVAKSVAQDQAQKGGLMLGAIVTIAAVATEQADERAWRTLPERISVARATLPYGKLPVEFQSGKGVYRTEVNIGNRFTVVPIRLTGGAVYMGKQNVVNSSWSGVAESQPVGGAAKVGKRPAKSARPTKAAPVGNQTTTVGQQ